MGKPRITPEEERQIISYAERGIYSEDISYMMSLPINRIKNALKRNSIQGIKRPLSKKMSYPQRLVLQKLTEAGKSLEDIAYIMQVSRATIYRELERGGANPQQIDRYSAEEAQRKLFG